MMHCAPQQPVRAQFPAQRLQLRQQDAVHFFALLGNAAAARHHPSAHGVSLPGRQQLHRTVPSQLERRRSLDGGVTQLRRSSSQHRPLDRGIQLRPSSSRSRKSHLARGLLGFHSCTKKRGPDCLVLRGAIHSPLLIVAQ
jgi:hypothetical protein